MAVSRRWNLTSTGQILRALLLLPFTATLLGPAVGAAPPKASPPNIIVIMFDDFSPRIGAYGDRLAKTPNLDAFARDSVRFNRAYATSPVCSPSRAAMMTGVHQETLGAHNHRTRALDGGSGDGPIAYEAVPPADIKSFTEALRAEGYQTIRTGKSDYQFGTPFTMWDRVEEGYWRDLPVGHRFFAWINLNHTHESFLFRPDTDISKHPNVKRLNPTLERNKRDFAGRPQPVAPADVIVPPYLPDTPAVRVDLAQVYAGGTYDDEEVGRIMATLKEKGLLSSTIVIIAADQGDGMPRYKRAPYPSGLQVPLMVRFPDGTGAGTVRDDLVSLIDLAPTILVQAGLMPPAYMQGRDLFGKKPAPDAVFAALDRMDEVPDRARVAIGRDYLYVRNAQPGTAFFRPNSYRDVNATMQEFYRLQREGKLTPLQLAYLTAPRPPEELYRLSDDSAAIANQANNPAALQPLIRMREQLTAWEAHTPVITKGTEEDLVDLIWPGRQQPQTPAPAIKFETKDCHLSVRVISGNPAASSGISLDGGAHFQLAASPIAVAPGQSVVAKSIRYGYRESPAVTSTAPARSDCR